MEYVDGLKITDYLNEFPDKLNELFVQTIAGFRHLEENKILHRDIRPENIMVSSEGLLKIIDFGFGKKVDFEINFDNSLSLNWRYSIPDDFGFRTYDFTTEVYFVGKLFEEVINERSLLSFSYLNILHEMTNPDPKERISSFFDVDRMIISGDTKGVEFSDIEQKAYLDFASDLSGIYSKIESNCEYLKDIDSIIMALDDVYHSCMLENFVQSPVAVAHCFVNGGFFFSRNAVVYVPHLKNFLNLLKSIGVDKKKIVINNLWKRLDNVKRYQDDDDLPF